MFWDTLCIQVLKHCIFNIVYNAENRIVINRFYTDIILQASHSYMPN